MHKFIVKRSQPISNFMKG